LIHGRRKILKKSKRGLKMHHPPLFREVDGLHGRQPKFFSEQRNSIRREGFFFQTREVVCQKMCSSIQEKRCVNGCFLAQTPLFREAKKNCPRQIGVVQGQGNDKRNGFFLLLSPVDLFKGTKTAETKHIRTQNQKNKQDKNRHR
jgi:hypothetical protein